jgi:hypothetical protein
MVADVLVRHCTLTVHGRGGWGWGTESSGYVAAALPAIEQALERVLRECDLDPGIDVRVEEPLRLTWRPDGTVPDDVRHVLVEIIRRAAAEAGPVPHRPAVVEEAQTESTAAVRTAVPSAAPASDAGSAVVALLAGWSQSGRLRQIVASWPKRVVTSWLDVIRRAADSPNCVDIGEAAVSAVAELVLAEEKWPVDETREGDRLIVLIGALVAAAGARPVGPATLAHAVGLAHGTNGLREWIGGAAAETPSLTSVGIRAPEEGDDVAAIYPAGAHPRELSRRIVAPGLPFLVMVQLSRIGYLEAVVAVAEATGLPEAARLIAAGVAGKVLPPPERGWRRSRSEVDAVAIASGLAPAEIDSTVYATRGDAELMLPPLESALIALCAAGRSAADEVVITTTANGLLCGEADGALPIAWLLDGGRLDPVLDQLGRPPVRHRDLFAPLARELAERPAFPHLEVPALERHLGVVAGAALGSLAQELWGTNTSNAPLLALERFNDLEVELRLDGVLAVAIPRGQRWLDLGRAGLLDRWAVPWANGGYWELVSW